MKILLLRAVLNRVESSFTFALAKLVPFFQPLLSKTKTNRVLLAQVSGTCRQLRVFALSSNWFIALFTFVVIGQRYYFGFGFTARKWKPLYRLYVFVILLIFVAPESKPAQKKKKGKQTTLLKTPPGKEKPTTDDKTPPEKVQHVEKKLPAAKK